MKRIAFFSSAICFIIFVSIIIIGETFYFNFITSALMINIGTIFLLLFFVFLCIIWNISIKKWVAKVLPIFFIFIFFISALFAINHMFDLYKDKESYTKKDFTIVEGIPDEVSFDRQDYLTDLKVDGVELDVTMLDMTKNDFKQKYRNNEIIVQYLPKTKLVVKIKSAE
ncbi:MAG TPA: hypothetical protein VK085_11280 [Pseudogracilibacillus sp.]|nr:hypothetical protein [Pseudogracilibacillus sp.]